MNATFHTRLDMPEDEDEIWVSKKGTIPFTPTIGMMFRPNTSDDFMAVEDVYYCGETGKLEVHLSPHAGTLDLLLSRGWSVSA